MKKVTMLEARGKPPHIESRQDSQVAPISEFIHRASALHFSFPRRPSKNRHGSTPASLAPLSQLQPHATSDNPCLRLESSQHLLICNVTHFNLPPRFQRIHCRRLHASLKSFSMDSSGLNGGKYRSRPAAKEQATHEDRSASRLTPRTHHTHSHPRLEID